MKLLICVSDYVRNDDHERYKSRKNDIEMTMTIMNDGGKKKKRPKNADKSEVLLRNELMEKIDAASKQVRSKSFKRKEAR